MKNWLILLLLMSTTPAAFTAEEPADSEETQTEAKEKSDTASEDKKQSSEPVPEADRLKQRELGDAFRRFVPSETISSDNAVPFPVDI
jgi:hypothetical protein|tara:strand:+ start:547 stop:810 length:264 start_codon:yes stop_codon:yes gene_type:complete